MMFLKGILLTCSFIVCVNWCLIVGNFMDFNHPNNYQVQEQVEWWMNYEKLPQESASITNKISEAVEYEGWITEPLEEVISSLSEYYGKPLIDEIIVSVSDFRQAPTDWQYSYKVDSVYLLQKSDERTIVIAEVRELLMDETVAKGLALITLDNDLKIIEQVFRWEY